MRVNEYFKHKGAFQRSVERLINVGYTKGNTGYIPCPIIQRFNEDPVSIIFDNATGKVTTVVTHEPSDPGAEQAGILWSIVGTRDYCMDIDAYGLTDTWFVNLECVGNTIERAHAIADETLAVLVNDGAILQIFTRFDEPIDSDQATRGEGYRSHNLTVSLNGVISESSPSALLLQPGP